MQDEDLPSSLEQEGCIQNEPGAGSTTTEFSRFLRSLHSQELRFDVAGEALQLRVIPIIGDGNCLYRSLSYALHGNQDSHQDIRREIVNYISSESNWNMYNSDILGQMDDYTRRTPETNDATPDNESLRNAYRSAMLQDGQYGRLTEATAFGNIHRRNIQVVQVISNAFVTVYSSRYDATLPTIRLLFSGDAEAGHYDLLLQDEPASHKEVEAGMYVVSNTQDSVTVFKKIDDTKIISSRTRHEKNIAKGDDCLAGNLAEFRVHTWKCPKGRPIRENIMESGLVKGRSTIFVVHGYKGGKASNVIKATVAQLLKLKMDSNKPGPKPQAYNVISVTWEKAANSRTYYPSKYRVPRVADEMLGMIMKLQENDVSTPGNTILIGHSLGAQICGFVGKYVYIHMKERINTIYALDAAGVGFDKYPETEKLCQHDATHVTALHTTRSFGTRHRCGTVDTYISYRGKTPFIPHVDVVLYFNRTIQEPDVYEGERRLSTYEGRVEGTGTIRIGWEQNHSDEGVYWVEINPNPPYDPEAQS